MDAVEYFHEALEPILKNTYGILVFQEQAILIAQQIAGFDLQEADILRKAIGKKKASVMAEVKKSFIEKSEPKVLSLGRKLRRYSLGLKSLKDILLINLILSAMPIMHISQHMLKLTSHMNSLLLI